ncbi:hypothetical protein BDAP_000248 [Binucleata daphniae]
MILYLSILYGWRSDTAYRIKLSGDEELYLVKIGNKMRMIKSVDFESQDNIINISNLLRNDDNSYYIEFCGGLLSAKSEDPGVIPKQDKSDLNRWFIDPYRNGYQFVNGKKCLTKMDAYDEELKGYYLNTQPCDKYDTNVFSMLDSGHILNFCKKNVQDICERYAEDMCLKPTMEDTPYKRKNRRSSRPKFSDTEARRDRPNGDRRDDPYNYYDAPEYRRNDQRYDPRNPKDDMYNDDYNRPPSRYDSNNDYPNNQDPRNNRRNRYDDRPQDRSEPRSPRNRRNYDDFDSESRYIDTHPNKTHHGRVTEDYYHHHE